ncbi:MAG: hypothetical protein DRO62_01635 [Candidatus Altiarchaeales archaeon]|nr:MAG: hypothetical protein DRO62_01635 [Candidatus Altiarchaeales archaeon]
MSGVGRNDLGGSPSQVSCILVLDPLLWVHFGACWGSETSKILRFEFCSYISNQKLFTTTNTFREVFTTTNSSENGVLDGILYIMEGVEEEY